MAKSKRSNRDHAHQHQSPGPDNEVIVADLQALLTPALFAQQAYYRQLGLRDRILNLSLMLAAALTMLWRKANTLLIMDRGFYHFQFWAQLIEAKVALICRLKTGASYTIEQVFTDRPHVKDQRIQ